MASRHILSSKDEVDHHAPPTSSSRCCTSPSTTNMAGGVGSTLMTDSFYGVTTCSERSDDQSTESRMCTEESVERMTSSMEGMGSLSPDDSEYTHAEAHGIPVEHLAAVACREHVRHRSSTSAHVDHVVVSSSNGICKAMELGDGLIPLAGASISHCSNQVNLQVRDVDSVDADEQTSDEQMMNGMLGSYREISLADDDDDDDYGCQRMKDDRKLIKVNGSSCSADAGADTEEEVSNLSPDSALPSPQYADEQIIDEDVAATVSDKPGDFETESAVVGLTLELPNRRPNSLQLMPSLKCNAGAQSKRPASSSSTSGTSPGKWNRYNHQQPAHETSRVLSTSAPVTGTISTTNVPSISSSSSISVSSSSDLEAMYGALQGLHGLIVKDGDLVSFVAEDLHEQIRRSSPVARRGDTPSYSGSRSSTPSLYKLAVTPQLMPIDPTIIDDVEIQARAVAASVDTILENLTGTLHSMSSLTVDCMESYRDSVCKTCDSMDGNIKAMYQLMAKIEELGNMMRPVHRLSCQIKEIKRLLDLLEQVASSSGS